jgi:signal recognition particle subunit SRP54
MLKETSDLAMFENLSKRLMGIFDGLRGKGVLSEEDVSAALREMRMALLEADVALPAVKALMEEVKSRAIGERLLKGITPVQGVIKIVHEALIAFLTHPKEALELRTSPPTVILMVGLQGGGKTSMCGKLGFFWKKKKVLMASLDVVRPAAQHQLALIGQSIDVDTLDIVAQESPLAIAKRALIKARGYDVLLLDTAGRLAIDEPMMQELRDLKALTSPHEIFLVADALSGQDVARTALAFHEALGITGMCLSRVDGDARGGAALSLRHVTQQPLKWMGTGELPHQGLPFDARRLADRILDQGDIIGFVEKVTRTANLEEEERSMQRLQRGIFTLDDFAKKLKSIESMGGLEGLLDYLPGMQSMKDKLGPQIHPSQLKRQSAILSSMTKKERAQPHLFNASRKRRIAKGSGTSVPEVNRLLTQFEQMQKMLKMMKGSPKSLMNLFRKRP